MIGPITWEMDRSHAPADPAERMELTMTNCEWAKQGLDSGRLKMWGMNPGGNFGFLITEGDKKAICRLLQKLLTVINSHRTEYIR